ncbi:hypothetical protein [Mobilicoccus caccae]|uniref:Uncharacterized protein n=1 Tax=Mobilicoccus caccae TaxID=1859295 RepID=A0ABQ6IQC8_9MICO|nr:hypothetical protein [Mobilicoccus caccae]GMA39407.1 hypothetical protein GCM10025883_14520 [Mobilicoccus caccae]
MQTDRPGTGLSSRCTPDKCNPFLHRLWFEDQLRRDWNTLVAEVAGRDPRVRTIPIDDVFCRDDAVPCDDTLPMTGGPTAMAAAWTPATPAAAVPRTRSTIEGVDVTTLARPDGSHFSPEAMPAVSAALLDRVAAAVQH